MRIINLSLKLISVTSFLLGCPNAKRCHGIDFKNPFTMSKRGQIPHSRIVKRHAKLLSSSLEILVGGGAYRDRTDDLMLAKQPLSQLS
jgi:hypothetical protein